jgi:glycosyltransferase involved in cell wall biosynthesis
MRGRHGSRRYSPGWPTEGWRRHADAHATVDVTRLSEALRAHVRDALSGRLGPTVQALTWRIVSLHPRLRVVRNVRSGDIRKPLAALDRSAFGLTDAVRLRERLADMLAFCDGRGTDGARRESPPASAPPAFNRRVLFALHNCGAFDPSGYASRSVALIDALGRQGVQAVITTRPGYPWDLAGRQHLTKAAGVDHRGLHFLLDPDPPFGLRDPDTRYIDSYAARLQRLAEGHGASVIHAASNYLNGAAAALAGRRAGLPSVYEVRGLWHLTRAFLEPGYGDTDHFRYCEQREVAACEEVDHVVTISPGLQGWLMERGIPADKISIIGNAAPPRTGTDAHAGATVGYEVRRRYGIARDAHVVGYLGSLVAYEGIDTLLRAHARTPPGRRPHLLIVGSGSHEKALRHLARELGTLPKVVFAGHVAADLVASHFEAMDAVFLPRKDDQLTRLVPALKPFEALAQRRPVFVSPALAQALGSTLVGGYHVLDLDTVDDLCKVLEQSDPVHLDARVPTWDDRAHALTRLYEQLCGAG